MQANIKKNIEKQRYQANKKSYPRSLRYKKIKKLIYT